MKSFTLALLATSSLLVFNTPAAIASGLDCFIGRQTYVRLTGYRNQDYIRATLMMGTWSKSEYERPEIFKIADNKIEASFKGDKSYNGKETSELKLVLILKNDDVTATLEFKDDRSLGTKTIQAKCF